VDRTAGISPAGLPNGPEFGLAKNRDWAYGHRQETRSEARLNPRIPPPKKGVGHV